MDKKKEMLSYFNDHILEMIEDSREMVSIESPSSDQSLLVEFGKFLKEKITQRTGLNAEEYPLEGTGPILIFRSTSISTQKQILLVCHYDTVHQKGSLQKTPFRQEGDILYGPGIFDMKIGIVQGIWALRYIVKNKLIQNPITLMLTPDEEIGSLKSRQMLEREGLKSKCAIILEPSQEGNIKIKRKGVARYDLNLTGLPAHSGIEPEKGASTIKEMAKLILELEALNDKEKGTTINVGLVMGGSAVNIVPEFCKASVDVRVWNNAEASRIESAFKSLNSSDAHVKVRVSGGFIRPPMYPSEQTLKIVGQIEKISNEFGLKIGDVAVGGGSDGNLIAPLGIPVIDGMGGEGGGAHTNREYVKAYTISPRTAMLTATLIEICQ